MFLKYDDCGDNVIINLPNSVVWSIRYRLFHDEGNEDCNLYLIVDDRQILLRDTDNWCAGRPNLPYYAVRNMYEEIVDVIATQIENKPTLTLIDLPAIENKLLKEKYEKMWIEKGYVELKPDGTW